MFLHQSIFYFSLTGTQPMSCCIENFMRHHDVILSRGEVAMISLPKTRPLFLLITAVGSVFEIQPTKSGRRYSESYVRLYKTDVRSCELQSSAENNPWEALISHLYFMFIVLVWVTYQKHLLAIRVTLDWVLFCQSPCLAPSCREIFLQHSRW